MYREPTMRAWNSMPPHLPPRDCLSPIMTRNCPQIRYAKEEYRVKSSPVDVYRP